jgi:ABC-type molybdate transport system substrate-binding protein
MVTSLEFNNKQKILCTQDFQTSVTLYAAGSLRGAISEVAQSFAREYDIPVRLEFNHSGLLRERLLNGEHSDIFASADMGNPIALMKANKSSPVVNFTRNRMCAIVKPGLKVTPNNLLDLMLNPEIKLGTSTPNEDASGDYAQEIFRKAEKVQLGSFNELNQKALRLVGGRNSPIVPKGRNELAYFITETQQVDIFLSYCTAARLALLSSPNLQIVELPEKLALKVNYGMTLMKNASNSGVMLAMYILSPDGQKILNKYGFDSPLISCTPQ